MSPLTQTDRHDAPWLVDESVPSITAVVDDIFVGCEDPVGEPVAADELPDVLDRVELGAFRRQGDECYGVRHGEPFRHVPSGLVEEEHGMPAGGDLGGDLGEVQVHRLDVAGGQDESSTFAFLRADGAKNVGGSRALVARCCWPCAAFGPTPGDLVFLADAGLVGEPDFYLAGIDALVLGDFVQTGGKTFLKSAMAPAACA